MRWLGPLVVGGSAGLALSLAALYWAVDRAAQQDQTRPADVIIVLGSQVREGGEPSGSLYARTQHAIELYRTGYAPTLLLSGGVGRYAPSEAAVMRSLALSAGVPETALVVDEKPTSTYESLADAAKLAPAYGWRSALIVSDPFHMFRARIMARDLGLSAYAAPALDSPLHQWLRLRRYYMVREVVALLWYWTLGRLAR